MERSSKDKTQLARDADYYLETSALSRAIERLSSSVHPIDRIDRFTLELMLQRRVQEQEGGALEPSGSSASG